MLLRQVFIYVKVSYVYQFTYQISPWIFKISIFNSQNGQEDGMHHYAKFCRNCFNIMLVWLENAYSHLFFGGFWFTFPPDDVTHHPNPKKDRLLV